VSPLDRNGTPGVPPATGERDGGAPGDRHTVTGAACQAPSASVQQDPRAIGEDDVDLGALAFRRHDADSECRVRDELSHRNAHGRRVRARGGFRAAAKQRLVLVDPLIRHHVRSFAYSTAPSGALRSGRLRAMRVPPAARIAVHARDLPVRDDLDRMRQHELAARTPTIDVLADYRTHDSPGRMRVLAIAASAASAAMDRTWAATLSTLLPSSSKLCRHLEELRLQLRRGMGD